jgi:hypothetical protein
MTRRTEGYRSQRLAKRRSARNRGWQGVVLYVLAGVVAFAAVAGAVWVSRRLTTQHVLPSDKGYIALVTFGIGEAGRQPVAGLLVHDRDEGSYAFYTIPRNFLFTGPHEEYVLGSDAMASGDFQAYVERAIHAKVDYRLDLTYDDLAKLTGGQDLWVELEEPVALGTEGAWRTYEGRFRLPAAEVAGVLSADGEKGPDEGAAEQHVLDAALKTAALQPAAERIATVDKVAGHLPRVREDDARDILDDLENGRVIVARLPSRGQTSEGQFVYRPNPEEIMASITRKSPEYTSKYTVVVENGSGEAGVAQSVAAQLAVLDVNLPAVRNADSFDYRQTQILAARDALGVADDVRAILGRGIVLSGDQLPVGNVVVIVGKDLATKDLQ